MSMTPLIAVMYFPGMNCEEETLRAIRCAGMEAELVLWNVQAEVSALLDRFDGFVLPGGWSYEDRIRAGAVASHQRLLQGLREQAAKGKPVLGICNGAQILVESGMVPNRGFEDVEFALAPNKNPFVSGYYCTWVTIKAAKDCAFAKEGEVLTMPIAHGEGRFVTSNEQVLSSVDQHIAFRYCDKAGEVRDSFPTNPNGSILNIAGLTNKEGNVLAIMPHPERATWLRQVPGFSQAPSHLAGPGRSLFVHMNNYIKNKKSARGVE